MSRLGTPSATVHLNGSGANLVHLCGFQPEQKNSKAVPGALRRAGRGTRRASPSASAPRPVLCLSVDSNRISPQNPGGKGGPGGHIMWAFGIYTRSNAEICLKLVKQYLGRGGARDSARFPFRFRAFDERVVAHRVDKRTSRTRVGTKHHTNGSTTRSKHGLGYFSRCVASAQALCD